MSKQALYCPYCGAEIKSSKSRYCDECGNTLSIPLDNQPHIVKKNEESNGVSLGKVAIILVMLCVIVFLSAFLLVNLGVVGEHYDIIVDNTWIQDFGDSKVYSVNGRILNSPDTTDNDYIIQVEYYDTNGNLLANPTKSLREANEWNMSGRISFGIYSTSNNPTIDHVIVKLLDHNGRVVGEVSNSFDNNNIESYV